jgi:hypothetical protein
LLQITIFVTGMKFSRRISKFISLFLIVVMMQKTVVGLYLHNWLHTPCSQTETSKAPGISLSGINCTCIDDFYLPFSETPEQVVPTIPVIETGFTAVLQFSIPFTEKILPSLRGPPSVPA